MVVLWWIIYWLKVPVPSRGAIFLNRKESSTLWSAWRWSFRPLPGSYILNPVAVLDRDSDTGFPSPLGELYFLMENPTTEHRLVLVSVPSRGAIFLNRPVRRRNGWAAIAFPSPLGELYFLIITCTCPVTLISTVSVPSRGAIFLNWKSKELRNL